MLGLDTRLCEQDPVEIIDYLVYGRDLPYISNQFEM